MEKLTLILSGNENSFTTFINPPIHLDKTLSTKQHCFQSTCIVRSRTYRMKTITSHIQLIMERVGKLSYLTKVPTN